MAANTNLHKAKTAKNDEFYTQLTDVSKELMHYKKHFNGKTVLCNCDDPTWSAFWKYFHLNFSALGLKKLISTHYDKNEPTYEMEYTGGDDNDIEVGVKTPLEGNGDFRNQECLDLLDEADIVVTNPPFSLFRKYVAVLMEHDKKFIVIGSQNAITYKDIFPLLKDDDVRLGFTHPKEFIQRDGTVKKFGNICWFTNLDIKKRHEELILVKKYAGHENEYPTYDNYDAIEVSKVADIPLDYDGAMGVPITFLDKYNPEQFEIIGLLHSSTDGQAGIPNLRYYDDFKEMRQDMSYTGASGKKANGNPVVAGKSAKGNFLYCESTNEYVHLIYARIVIRNKHPEQSKEVQQ